MSPLIRKLSIVFVTLIRSLACMELFLRTNGSMSTYEPFLPAYIAPCFEKGTFYWFRLKTSSTCILHSPGNAFGDVTIQSNNMGLRGTDIPIPKPTNTTRILFLGDSFTMGWGVSQEDAYPAVIQTFMNA